MPLVPQRPALLPCLSLAVVVVLVCLLTYATQAYGAPGDQANHIGTMYEYAVAGAMAISLFGGALGILLKPWRSLEKRVTDLETVAQRHADHLGLRSEVDRPLRGRVDSLEADRERERNAIESAAQLLERATKRISEAAGDA